MNPLEGAVHTVHARGDVSYLCDKDHHQRCTGVVGSSHVVSGGRWDGVSLRLCGCRNRSCTCRDRADLAGTAATIRDRSRRDLERVTT